MNRKHEWIADLLWLTGTLTAGATLGLLFWLMAVLVGWTHEAPNCVSNATLEERVAA